MNLPRLSTILIPLCIPLLAPLLATAAPATTPSSSLLLHHRDDTSCTLTLAVSGSVSGPVGQYSNGQAIAGPGATAAELTLVAGGGLYDSQGRGCWWTPPSTVLQCDVNQTPDTPFSVSCDGSVTYAGQTTFYQCLADASSDTHNVYLAPDQGSTCGEVTLTASGSCVPSCPSPTPTPAPAPDYDNNDDSESTCPKTTLDTGSYEFPHLMIPISSSSPSTANPTSYNGDLAPGAGTIFNFDVQPEFQGKTCALVFLFPTLDQLETSSFSISGSGDVDFSRLDGYAVEGTTSWDNSPAVAEDYGVTTLVPGNGYVIAQFDCPAGQTVAFKMDVADDGDTCFTWFQDYNPQPIGLYITVC